MYICIHVYVYVYVYILYVYIYVYVYIYMCIYIDSRGGEGGVFEHGGALIRALIRTLCTCSQLQ